jgi:hypothetical protein
MQVDEHSEGISRADALLTGGLAAGAVLGLGAFGPYLRRALALAGDSDADTLNLLLKFEHLQIELYEESKSRLKASPELKQTIAMLADQEHQHLAALTDQIKKVGGKPLPENKNYGVFGYRRSYVDTFLYLARSLESVTVGAYNGAIPLLKSKEAQRLASSIVQVEGRHAATVALRGGEEPAPEAFDPVRSEYAALDSVIRWAGPIDSPSN